MDAPWMNQVDRFCHQYLQLEPQLDYPEPSVLREAEVQDCIYSRIFADDAVRYAPPPRYRFRVLKDLVSRIEGSISDWDEHAVSDDLMAALSVHLASPLPEEASSAQKKCYVTYHLSALSGRMPGPNVTNPCVTLLENRALISAAGTTGLRTWEAAMHLGQYLCRNPSIVKNKRVLELGAGTGYLSVLCANFLGASHVIASDGSDDVVNSLPDNFFLNGLQDSTRVRPMDIKWGHALLGTEDEEWNNGEPVHVLLGADITYDDSVIPRLVATLTELFGLYPNMEVYISATQRNIQTFQVFLDLCQRRNYTVEDMQFEIPSREIQDGPFYNDQVAIRICKVVR